MTKTQKRMLHLMGKRVGRGINFILKVIACLFFAFPFYWMFVTSFKTNIEAISFPPTLWPKDFTIEAYVSIFRELDLGQYLSNSAIIIISIATIQMIVMIPAAYAFARMNFRGRDAMFALVLIAFMIPVQITFVSVYILFAGTTVLGTPILKTLLPQIIPFGANAFGIFLLRQNFKQVPEELVEAARLDGAGELKIIFRVMLPMAKATIVTIALFSFISHWNSYFWPLVMTSAEELKPITLALEKLKDVEYGIVWPILMGGNAILVAPVLLIFLLASKKIIQAMAYRGMK